MALTRAQMLAVIAAGGSVSFGQRVITAAADVPTDAEILAAPPYPPPTALKDISAGDYETVAASQTAQAFGETGAAGDYLSHLLIIPATTSPGAVSVKDGGGADITVFAGGANSVSNLVPFVVPVGAISAAGAWKVTTGASVSVVAFGNFT